MPRPLSPRKKPAAANSSRDPGPLAQGLLASTVPPPARFNPINQSHVRSSSLFDIKDAMARNLLIQKALVDSKEYEILSLEEIDDLKNEYQILHTRTEALRRKLDIESKVRDAAVSLAKLHVKSKRNSAMAEDQILSANRKVDDVAAELWHLVRREDEVYKRILQHNAGILNAGMEEFEKDNNDIHGRRTSLGVFDAHHLYRAFDAPTTPKSTVFSNSASVNETVYLLEEKLRETNQQLKNLLGASPELTDDSSIVDDSSALDQAVLLQRHIKSLVSLHDAELRQIEDAESGRALILMDLWDKLPSARKFDPKKEAEEEEEVFSMTALIKRVDHCVATGEEYQAELKELDKQRKDELNDLCDKMDDMQSKYRNEIQRLESQIQDSEDVRNSLNHRVDQSIEELEKAIAKEQLLDTTVTQLNEKLEMAERELEATRNLENARDDEALIEERQRRIQLESEFLQKLQAKDQEILRLQEEYRRADNGHQQNLVSLQQKTKSQKQSMEQLEFQLSTIRDKMAGQEQRLRETEQELVAKTQEQMKAQGTIEEHENEIIRSKSEIVMLKAQMDEVHGSRQQRKAEAAHAARMAAQISADQAKEAELSMLRTTNRTLRSQVEELQNIPARSTTSKGPTDDEIALRNRCTMLQEELNGMLASFETLTKSQIEFETERLRLEHQNDLLLIERNDLENQLADEKVRNMGRRTGLNTPCDSPGTPNPGLTSLEKDTTSIAILRREFRKMVQQMRTEHQKVLKVELDERRRLEGLVRQLKGQQQT
ncbi:hypothetical protein NEOLI_002980 [Neolecta irregularis DAH-3]|uniref:Uncharacterized protein n=1 Tax=Neolecta irregularis (strain DAH-3) TaxID=1198029 RepID=A0A1U7LR72_NEOID|nr:hypothetical protein NEOLI_002980 [Neolecta irregularis DAH-3]|eukprot:OLL25157.1 hypothetical protein NEOLI_002980 [Neolecta irregularis DAH-3]